MDRYSETKRVNCNRKDECCCEQNYEDFCHKGKLWRTLLSIAGLLAYKKKKITAIDIEFNFYTLSA